MRDLLFQWETRDFGPVRRRATAFWRRMRGTLSGAGIAAILIVAGAAATHDPALVDENRTLAAELEEARNALTAREGELELARLELNRMSRILAHSAHNRIPADLARAIHDIAISEGVDPALAFSLVRAESGFVRRAVSKAGAVGFTQVMPRTAFWLQPNLKYSQLFDRDTNLRLGFRYLRLMLQQYEGDLHLALLAYNRGPGRVDDILRAGGDPSNGYARNVRDGVMRTVGQTQ